MDTRDIEGCHRLPLSKNSRGHDRRVIVKFFNRKYAEAMLKDKKRISGKNLGQLNVTNKIFFSVSLRPYYRLIWGKFKDLPRQGKVHHVFCLGGIFILYINYCIMETQLNSIILVTFLTSFWTRILKINFCKYSICSVYIVNLSHCFVVKSSLKFSREKLWLLLCRRCLSSLSGVIVAKILKVIDWSQVLNHPLQFESAAATRINCS